MTTNFCDMVQIPINGNRLPVDYNRLKWHLKNYSMDIDVSPMALEFIYGILMVIAYSQSLVGPENCYFVFFPYFDQPWGLQLPWLTGIFIFFESRKTSRISQSGREIRSFWCFLAEKWINWVFYKFSMKMVQDGRLAPAYFSPNYKYFDQLLQTVKNKTTVLILVFKEFLQTPIRPLISVLYAKGYHDFPLKIFFLTVPKNFVEEPFCVSEKFWYRKMLRIREGAGITIFCQNCFVSQYRKTS